MQAYGSPQCMNLENNFIVLFKKVMIKERTESSKPTHMTNLETDVAASNRFNALPPIYKLMIKQANGQ